jgi:hypothetical protein
MSSIYTILFLQAESGKNKRSASGSRIGYSQLKEATEK